MSYFVVVSGNLGVGKTSLVDRIEKHFEWQKLTEPVIENPYLVDYYNDMRTWAYHLQVYFLVHRAKQQFLIPDYQGSVVMDRSTYECSHVFARALYYQGYISERDYFTYLEVFNLVTKDIPVPDLVVYLKASPQALMKRIEERGLEFDYRGIDEEYLTLIDNFYDNWIEGFDLCPILKFNTEELDYVNDKACLIEVMETIKGSLPV